MSYPHVVTIDDSLSMEERVALLLGVLNLDNKNDQQIVEICADIDLTGHTGIEIWDNRSLIAPPSCARSPRRLGPRVYVTDERGRNSLFDIHGDNVLVSGFRLEGPTDYIAKGNRKEKGIVVSPTVFAPDDIEKTTPLPIIRNVVISNMEIYHWSGVGVQVQDNVHRKDSRGRLVNTNPAGVRVTGCYFHHNRHGPGEGYGVNSTGGGYVTIERNVFDENRHAIAGGPKHKTFPDYSGYTARDNLILSGGGVHQLETSARDAGFGGLAGAIIGGIIGGLIGGPPGAAIGAAFGAGAGFAGVALAGSYICWQTHQIDMHGTKSTIRYGQACCGTAGETMIIERNTILYVNGNAIKIRGNPIDKVVVDANVFRHKTADDAIAQNGDPGITNTPSKPITVEPTNTWDCGDLLADLGKGDFFGDGQLEDFMATGVTWWARSPITGHWRYLNTMKERLPQLQLIHVDGDAICDVAPKMRELAAAPPEKYSKGGTTPWLQRNVIHP